MSVPSPAVMPRRPTAVVPAPRPAPVPAMPPYRATDVDYDPQCTIGYWNRPCARPGCSTWVPKHRAMCATHEET